MEFQKEIKFDPNDENKLPEKHVKIEKSKAEKVIKTNPVEHHIIDMDDSALLKLPAEIAQKIMDFLEDGDLKNLRITHSITYSKTERFYEKKTKSLYHDDKNAAIFKRNEHEDDRVISSSQKKKPSYGGTYYRMQWILYKTENPTLLSKRGIYHRANHRFSCPILMLGGVILFILIATMIISSINYFNENSKKYLSIAGTALDSFLMMVLFLTILFDIKDVKVQDKKELNKLENEKIFISNHLHTLFHRSSKKDGNEQTEINSSAITSSFARSTEKDEGTPDENTPFLPDKNEF